MMVMRRAGPRFRQALRASAASVSFAFMRRSSWAALARYRLPIVLRICTPDQPKGLSARASGTGARPTFAAIVTVHNQSADQLRRCFASLLDQEERFQEVIVVDDGSNSPESVPILQQACDVPGWVLVRQRNAGVVSARNNGADRASADYLVFVDPDDWLTPSFVSLMRSASMKAPNCDVIYGDVMLHGRRTTIWRTGPFGAAMLTRSNSIPVTSAIRTRLFRSLGGFRPQFAHGYEDWDLWARASQAGATATKIPIPVYHYTRAEGGRNALAQRHYIGLSRRIRGSGP